MFGDQKKTLIIGTFGVVALAAYIWQVFDKKQKPKLTQTISDEILIKFIKQLRALSFPHLFLVSDVVKQQRIEYKGDHQEIFIRIKQEIDLLFEKKQQMILFKLELDYNEVQQSLQLSENEEVKNLQAQFLKLYEDSLDGIQPEIKLSEQTLAKFNQAKSLKILGQVLAVSVNLICLATEELMLRSDCPQVFNLDQPIVMKALIKNGLIDKKLELLSSLQINEYEKEEPCPIELFSKLIQYYKLENPKFKQCVEDIENLYENIIQKILKKEIDSESARSASTKIDIDEIIKKLT
ncbi:unnamed protein product (macronuclear) [Paramecium tetraurelia]|uniref:Transmembrane protein n=1 Tax=Paramecium tetraurelia TaxID=5888 RepID=A0DBK9_PARTE|nr:uncharacterized protein GSPATT00015322001 [Paramecium tetraurelia]CAK80426.1 unnamed protein product [Paramecium tetraurelia]|eukprot:XP_001447823.1 hypothetical protein (macronuclear) [Paramecium tetraurelia strain d4-2]